MMVNYIAVLVAGVAGWLIGAAYYGVLGPTWMAAQGKTPEQIATARAARRMPVGPMVLAIVVQFIMAAMLAGLMGHIGGANVQVGIVTGVLVWVGFVATTIAVNNAFQGKSVALTIIDGAHWLLVLIAQGVIIGLFG